MPWYVIQANHGPGHQSSSHEIIWQEVELNDEEEEELWLSEFDTGNYDNAYGNTWKIPGLPEEEVERLLKYYESKIKNAEHMKNVLLNTKPIQHKFHSKHVCDCGESMRTCGECGKWVCYSDPNDKLEFLEVKSLCKKCREGKK